MECAFVNACSGLYLRHFLAQEQVCYPKWNKQHKRKEFKQEMSVEETVCAVVAGSTIAVATLFVVGMLVLIIIDKRKENKNESKGRN